MRLSKIKEIFINYRLLFVFGLIILVFFQQFLLGGKLPVPADTIVGMYHPWREVVWDRLTAGVPFKNFLITDPVRQQYPWRQLTINLFKQGQLPLWNPYTYAGTPLLANFQGAPFYPLNVLFFLLPFNLAWGILILLQPLLGGIFLYFYLRQLKLRPIAALVGALSFSFSGFFIAWLEWGTLLHAALWLPLILLAIEKIFAGKIRLKWGALLIFSLCSQFFAGHLQVSFYVFLVTIVYLFWKFAALEKRRSSYLGFFAVVGLIVTILTAVQWLPTLQFIKLSAREIDQSQFNQPGWFIPWQHLIQFLAPDFFGSPTTLNYWGVFNYAEFIGYLGVIPLIFAFYAIFWRREKRVVFFAALLFITLSFALPTPWAKLPFRLGLPFIATSQPTRLLLVVDFCLAILAALGIDFLLAKKTAFKKIVFTLLLFLFLYGLLWLFVLGAGRIWPNAPWITNLAVSKRNLILPTVFLAAGAILFLALPFKKIPKKIIFSLVFLIICFDLLRFGGKFTPFVKEEWLFPTTRTIEFLKKDKEVFRLMTTDRRLFPPNFSLPYKLQTIEGYDPLYLTRYAELIAALERGEPDIAPPFGFNRIITPHNYQSRLIDLMNVKYVLSLKEEESPKLVKVFQEGQTRVYENKNAFPRAFMVYDYRLAKDRQGAVSLLMDKAIELTKTVILEEKPPELKFIEGKGGVKIKRYQENQVTIEVETDQRGILVLTDSYYPGWRVSIDGKEAKIYRADYNFRGIIVPEGNHQLVFEYGWY